MKRSFLSATAKVRAGMQAHKSTSGGKVYLLNAVGYAMLSLMGPFDGTFSEGATAAA